MKVLTGLLAFTFFVILPWPYIYACIKWAKSAVNARPDIRAREAALKRNKSSR